MRKLLITLGLALLLAGTHQASGQKTGRQKPKYEAQISFDAAEHDFGVIMEGSKKASYDYVFTNTGKHPLVITRVTASCKCMDFEYSRRPVPPGGRGVITATYNPRKQHGIFYKAIQIYANTPEERHVIIAKGEVKP